MRRFLLCHPDNYQEFATTRGGPAGDEAVQVVLASRDGAPLGEMEDDGNGVRIRADWADMRLEYYQLDILVQLARLAALARGYQDKQTPIYELVVPQEK